MGFPEFPQPSLHFGAPQEGRPTWSPCRKAEDERTDGVAHQSHQRQVLAAHLAVPLGTLPSPTRNSTQTAHRALTTRRLQLGVTGGAAPLRQPRSRAHGVWPRRVAWLELTSGPRPAGRTPARRFTAPPETAVTRPSRASSVPLGRRPPGHGGRRRPCHPVRRRRSLPLDRVSPLPTPRRPEIVDPARSHGARRIPETPPRSLPLADRRVRHGVAGTPRALQERSYRGTGGEVIKTGA